MFLLMSTIGILRWYTRLTTLSIFHCCSCWFYYIILSSLNINIKKENYLHKNEKTKVELLSNHEIQSITRHFN
jgi:hypothetical protein